MITDDGRRYLEPCPFCDGEAVHEFDNGEPIIHFYHDDGCFLAGVETMYDCPSAVETWNRRAERTCRDALLKLADELDENAELIIRAARNARFTGRRPTMEEAKHDAGEWRYIARRIREALGVCCED